MNYAWIEDHRDEFSVTRMCARLRSYAQDTTSGEGANPATGLVPTSSSMPRW